MHISGFSLPYFCGSGCPFYLTLLGYEEADQKAKWQPVFLAYSHTSDLTWGLTLRMPITNHPSEDESMADKLHSATSAQYAAAVVVRMKKCTR
jgi:hypothetical protein